MCQSGNLSRKMGVQNAGYICLFLMDTRIIFGYNFIASLKVYFWNTLNVKSKMSEIIQMKTIISKIRT